MDGGGEGNRDAGAHRRNPRQAGRATAQAVTKVNTDVASKSTITRRPSLWFLGEGNIVPHDYRWRDDFGGVAVAAWTESYERQLGKSSSSRERNPRKQGRPYNRNPGSWPTGERMTDRLVVPRTPKQHNFGGGKGPDCTTIFRQHWEAR